MSSSHAIIETKLTTHNVPEMFLINEYLHLGLMKVDGAIFVSSP